MKNNLIVKKNEFLKFGYSLPMTEQSLLLACISQVDSRTALDDDHKFVVRVQEMRDLFSDESKNLYRDLKSACETLWDREVVRVDELRRLFDLEVKYPEFKELKRSVVDKAVSEINKLSNLSVW